MDNDNYVPISLIASFKLIKRLTYDLQLIIDVLKESSLVEVDNEERKVRSSIFFPKRKRCIIILRNVPQDANENEILELFQNKLISIIPIGCERVLESDHLDCWYVTFNSEDDAQNAFLYLTRENISIRGQKILARMKGCLQQKSSIPTQKSFIPISVNPTPRPYYNTNHVLTSNPQQIHMNFPQINRTQPVFPTHFWYLPSPAVDSYTPMFVPLNSIIRTYNNSNKSKTRITSSKPRNSTTKPTTTNEELSSNNKSHSEDNNSSLEHETLLNSNIK